MQDIEPFYLWREKYIASDDENTPFHGRIYNEFGYTHSIYNYVIHPQWDAFGSSTLYTKLLYVDYEKEFAIFEMLGEWNDALHNDIMFFKRDVIDLLIKKNIHKYVIICENVLNFHGSENDYYEEWHEDIISEGGWICFLNTLHHVTEEMDATQLQYYCHYGNHFDDFNWRKLKPKQIIKGIELLIHSEQKGIRF